VLQAIEMDEPDDIANALGINARAIYDAHKKRALEALKAPASPTTAKTTKPAKTKKRTR